MRFHIGFSKFIKPSRLLYWLGLGFIGLLAWLGLTQQEVLASQTFTNFKWCSYTPQNVTTIYSQMAYGGTVTNNLSYNGVNAFNSRCDTANNGPIANYKNLLVATKRNINDASNVVFQEVSFDIDYDFCSNVPDTNSLDMFFVLNAESIETQNGKLTNANSFQSAYGTITSYADLLTIAVRPIYDNDISIDDYYCHIDSNDNTTTLHNVVCEGLPYNSHVTGYTMSIYNNIYQTADNKANVFYINNNVTDGNNRNYIYGWRSTNTYSQFEKTMDYQCSYVEPVNPDNPLFPEDSTGQSNITINDLCSCSGPDCACADTNNTDLYTSWVNDIDISEGLQDLITLPKRIIDVVIDESGDTCSPISINFSSFTQRFGGFNYSLQLPCMRTTLSTLLNYQIFNNVTIYNLIDLLMGFGLLIVFANRIHGAINNILSGDSLSEYTDL